MTFLTLNQIVPGVKFKDGRNVCTVTDILKTYNMANELVKTRYVATHPFMGQQIRGDYCAVTIQRGYIE